MGGAGGGHRRLEGHIGAGGVMGGYGGALEGRGRT